jgi:hypothetical protein
MSTKVSPKQQAANERNAQLSSGPRTAEGIENCKHNSLTHGFASNMTVLPFENQVEYDALLDEFEQEHAPEGPTELTLVHQVAAATWKLRRLANIENGVFELMLSGPSATPPTTNPIDMIALELTTGLKTKMALALLSRYQSALNRQFMQAIKELRTIQDRRHLSNANAEKSALLHELGGNTERTQSDKYKLEMLTNDPEYLVNYIEADCNLHAGIAHTIRQKVRKQQAERDAETNGS